MYIFANNMLYNALLLNKEENLRHKICLPKFNLSHYQNNFCYQGPKFWNSLCASSACYDSIILAPSLNSQKSRLKKLFLKVQSYGDEVEWLPHNKSLEKYLIAVKHDP